MRIRHYGFLANRSRRKRLTAIRETLTNDTAKAQDEVTKRQDNATDTMRTSPTTNCPCPQCLEGKLIVIAMLLPKRRRTGIMDN